MSKKITMPQLGESVTEGTLGHWLVQEGDHVRKYDPLCEVMTDKVNAEVPSSYEGVIEKIVLQEGETIQVGELMCYIKETAQSEGTSSQEVTVRNEDASLEDEHGTERELETVSVAKDQKQESAVSVDMSKRYSPAVLKLSQEHHIDLEQVTGTGKGGRVTRKDILHQVDQSSPSSTTSASVSSVSAPSSKAAAKEQQATAPEQNQNEENSHISPKKSTAQSIQNGDVAIPLTGMRRAIAKKMVQSQEEIPHAWTMVEVDVTDLVAYRNRVKQEFQHKEGVRLTFLPFFIKAVVEALKEYPIVNSQWGGHQIIQKKDINISLSVGTDDALQVPVIHNADEMSILGLARKINELAEKTRAGQLTTEDNQGGTFTVNNTGSFGSLQSSPIINFPQAAILSVESIVKRPVIKNNMIAIRDMVNLCLSLDHRILDGIICGRFLQRIKQQLEDMENMQP